MLKTGWVNKPLGEVCTLQRGFDLPKHSRTDGEFPLISSSGEIDRIVDFKVNAPGVATGRSGSIGNVFFIEENYWPLNTVLYVKDFHGNDERFVYYLLKRFDLNKYATGAGVPTLNRNHVHDEIVAIPESKEEQTRIVAILDEAFANISQAVANAEKNLANARELFDSYLNEVFTRKGEGWTSATISEVIKFIDYRGKTPVKTESGIRLITAKNIKMGYLQKHPMEFIASDSYDDWMTRGIPRKGDILFTTEAPLANVAQLDTDNKVAFAQRVIIMQPNKSRINSDFLKYLLISDSIQQLIHAKGTGATVKGIKASLLKLIEIPFPSDVQSQITIANKLDELTAQIQQLEDVYRRKLAALAELKQALLQKAFTGELTAAD